MCEKTADLKITCELVELIKIYRFINSGDGADGMYFIEDGKVSIRIMQDSGSETEISKLVKGQYFGELALVTHRPRAASVYAEQAVKVACKFLITH